MPAMTIAQALQAALAHHQAGRLGEAEAIYRQVLAQEPNQPDALHLLGVIATRAGDQRAAEELVRRAMANAPPTALYHNSLGFILRQQKQLEAAIQQFDQALRLKPDDAPARRNLADTLAQAGRIGEAIDVCRAGLKMNSADAVLLRNLGDLLAQRGDVDAAIDAYHAALRLQPNLAEVHNNLGNALSRVGRSSEAIDSFGRAIILAPDFAPAYNNLGAALQRIGRLDQAVASFQRAIDLDPASGEAHQNLGAARWAQGEREAAIVSLRAAVARNPDLVAAHRNLGAVLSEVGELDQAIASFRRALALAPQNDRCHSSLIFAMQFHPDVSAELLRAELAEYNRRHAAPLRALHRPHKNARDPRRRLRIGYVSPNFRDHVQALFTLPLLSNHDRQQVQVVCYSDAWNEDHLSERIKTSVDVWRNTAALSDEQLAAQVYDDAVDLLVDLTMHMEGCRLLAFARKPAPVQFTWLAYPGSTGVEAIDYRLSDPHLDPIGVERDQLYVERTIRLPETFWCYDPLDGVDLAVVPPPAAKGGRVTFGCLNNFSKVNERVLELWASILSGVRDSRLLILAPRGAHRQRVLDVLSRHDVDAERIEFVTERTRRQYLELYQRIDIVLDPFPYNGHTTTLDALWMGVPVVTMPGRTVVGRGGVSILTNVGLPELIGESPQQYVQIATDLAGDAQRLAALRGELRERLRCSPLMDAGRYAAAMEAAYRQAWHTWCASP